LRLAVLNFSRIFSFKGQVQCFSMLVVMNNCFFLKPERKKFGADPKICLVVFEKNSKFPHFNLKNDVTEPKARLSNNQIKSC